MLKRLSVMILVLLAVLLLCSCHSKNNMVDPHMSLGPINPVGVGLENIGL